MQLASYTVFKTLLSNNRTFKGLKTYLLRQLGTLRHPVQHRNLGYKYFQRIGSKLNTILKILKNTGFSLLSLGLILHKQQQSLHYIYAQFIAMASPNSGRRCFTLADLEFKILKTVNIPEGRNHSVQPDLYFPSSFSVISRAELAEIFTSPQRVLKKNSTCKLTISSLFLTLTGSTDLISLNVMALHSNFSRSQSNLSHSASNLHIS